MASCLKTKTLGLVALSLMLSQCSYLVPVTPNDPAYAPVIPSQEAAPPVSAGSLYRERHSLTLYADRVAHRVGDTITIVLKEKTDANKTATTNSSKSSNTNISNPTITGSPVKFNAPSWLPLDSNKNNNLNFNIQGERDFAGSGDSKQNNSLTGTITVTVMHVYPNGNLFIRGEKWLTINRGDEYIRLSGIIRPDDIRPDNTVDSERLADARITYSGRGQVAETNEMGWLQRFFNGATKLWAY